MMLDARARRRGSAEAHRPFSVEPIGPLSSKYWVSLNIYEMPCFGPVRVTGHCRTGAGGAVSSMDADVPSFRALASDGTREHGALRQSKFSSPVLLSPGGCSAVVPGAQCLCRKPEMLISPITTNAVFPHTHVRSGLILSTNLLEIQIFPPTGRLSFLANQWRLPKYWF
jgi:hypothetical protein